MMIGRFGLVWLRGQSSLWFWWWNTMIGPKRSASAERETTGNVCRRVANTDTPVYRPNGRPLSVFTRPVLIDYSPRGNNVQLTGYLQFPRHFCVHELKLTLLIRFRDMLYAGWLDSGHLDKPASPDRRLQRKSIVFLPLKFVLRRKKFESFLKRKAECWLN